MKTEFREGKTVLHTADLSSPPPVGCRVVFPSGAARGVTGLQLLFGTETRWVVNVGPLAA